MTVVIQSKSIYEGTITPSDLNTETVVVQIPSQTDEYTIEGYIDLSQLQDGDEIIITEYVSVDGTNTRKLLSWKLANTQDEPVVRFHSKIIPRDGLYTITITQTSGTVRSFSFWFVQLLFGTV